jgi:hypothetical protein
MTRLASGMVAAAYAALAFVFWGRFVLERGLHAETVWIELSQARPGWAGFLYPYDANRRFMSLPFHAAYLLSDGSYLTLHLLYGAFVFLTGWLTWLLVKRLLPQAPLVAFLAGAIALVHGADQSTLTTPMIVVRQAVVAMVAALLLLRIGWDRRWRWLLLPIGVLQAISLWTYEPGLLMLGFGPVLIWQGSRAWRPWIAWTAAWLVVPAYMIYALVDRYLIQGQTSYQSRQIEQAIDVGKAVTGLARLVYDGVVFWKWPTFWQQTQMNGCETEIMTRITPALAAGVTLFIVSGLACIALWRRAAAGISENVPWIRALAIATAFLAFAYLPFLALGEVGGWRTQFYAAPPAAVLMALVLVGVDRIVRARGFFGVSVAAAVVCAGLFVGLVAQLEMGYRWRIHRHVMKGIVDAAPRLKDDTFVALTNLPTKWPYAICDAAPPVDPFLDTMWFNSALQVLYPNTRLVGIYWREDRTSPGAIQYRFSDAGVSLVKTSIEVEGKAFGYDQVVVFRYEPATGTRMLETVPVNEIPDAVASPAYVPSARVLPGSAPVETMRKLAR